VTEETKELVHELQAACRAMCVHIEHMDICIYTCVQMHTYTQISNSGREVGTGAASYVPRDALAHREHGYMYLHIYKYTQMYIYTNA